MKKILIAFSLFGAVFTSQAQMRILIDPGHGGKDPGITSEGITESEITLKLARRVNELANQYGLQANLSRTENNQLDLPERVAGTSGYDLLVSIHLDAIPEEQSRYSLTISESSPYGEQAKTAAESMQMILKGSGLPMTEIKKGDNLFILNKSSCPSILISVGNANNASDMSWHTDPQKFERLAQSIAKSLVVLNK